jgi:hypothetical protein
MCVERRADLGFAPLGRRLSSDGSDPAAEPLSGEGGAEARGERRLRSLARGDLSRARQLTQPRRWPFGSPQPIDAARADSGPDEQRREPLALTTRLDRQPVSPPGRAPSVENLLTLVSRRVPPADPTPCYCTPRWRAVSRRATRQRFVDGSDFLSPSLTPIWVWGRCGRTSTSPAPRRFANGAGRRCRSSGATTGGSPTSSSGQRWGMLSRAPRGWPVR